MKSFVQPGSILDLTVPAGGFVSGHLYKVGAIVGVPQCTVTADEVTADPTIKAAVKVDGVFELNKISAQAWAEGDLIYMNTTSRAVTNVSATGVVLVGVATEVAANPSAVGRVRLNGVSAPAAVA